jgi:molybdenum cofactor cytidylyltransferase
MLKTAIVVLAAGKSTRMGSPKQLLNLFGKSMIVSILDTVLKTECYPVVAVLGANGIKISKEIEKMPITVIDNPNFESGMASSIVSGLIGAYMTSKEIDSIIFITSDQPQITPSHIQNLIEKAENSNKNIIASKFTGGFGIPALFKKPLFEEILDLKGDNGAKKLIMKFKESVDFVDFKDGNLDLDTMEDYNNYLSLN